MDYARRQRAEELYEEAVALEENRELEAALERYERALAIDPAFDEALVGLAYLQIRLGDELSAEKHLRTAVEISEHPVAYYNLGWIAEGREDFVQSRDCYRRALELSDDFIDAAAGLAAASLALGEVEEAEHALLRLEELSSGNEYLAELRRALPRYRELSEELKRTKGKRLAMKSESYLSYGAICLGTGSDDGVHIPDYFFYNYARAELLSATLGRFLALREHFGWRFTAVAACDAESLPLAHFLAGQLSRPAIAPETARAAQQVLLVAAAMRDLHPYQQAREKILARKARAFAFVLGLWPDCYLPPEMAPQVLGLLSPVSVYWCLVVDFARAKVVEMKVPPADAEVSFPPGQPRIDSRAPEEIAREIAAHYSCQPEANLQEQLRWYEQLHPHLNFPLRSRRLCGEGET